MATTTPLTANPTPTPVAATSTPTAPVNPAVTIPTAPVAGSQQNFGTALGQVVSHFQTMSPVQDQRNKLLKQLYDQPLTPEELRTLSPGQQQAVRSGNQDLIQGELLNVNNSLSGRATSLSNAITYATNGYTADLAAAQDKRDKANTIMYDLIKTLGSSMSEVGITNDDVKNFYATGQMSPEMATKLMKAETVAQQKTAAEATKTTTAQGLLTMNQVATIAATSAAAGKDPTAVFNALAPFVGKSAAEAGDILRDMKLGQPVTDSSGNMVVNKDKLTMEQSNDPKYWKKDADGKDVYVGPSGAFSDIAKSTPSSGFNASLTPAGQALVGQIYATTGSLPYIRSQAQADAINMAAEEAAKKGQSLNDIISAQTNYKADAASLKKLQAVADATEMNEKKAVGAANIVLGLNDKVWRSFSPWLNSPMLWVAGTAFGDKDTQNLANAIQTLTTEYGKVIANAAGNSELTVGAQLSAQKRIKAAQTKEDIIATVNLLQQEMDNSTKAVHDQLTDIKQRVADSGKTETSPTPTSTDSDLSSFIK